MTRKDALQVWASRFRVLRAWGRPLEEVTVEFRERAACYSTGVAYPGLRRVVVTAGVDVPGAISTILHELAHQAAGRAEDHHGPRWRRIYGEAVAEVTGVHIEVEPLAYRQARQAIEHTIARWWRQSGNERLWRALGV